MADQWMVLVGTNGEDATEKDLDGFHTFGPMSYGAAHDYEQRVRDALTELRKNPAFREPYGVIATAVVPVREAKSPQAALDNWYTLEGED